MKKNLSLTILCSMIILIACQKEVNDPGQVVIPVDSSINLKRFVVVDPGLVAPNDTVGTINYSYDNLHRCSTISADNYPYPGLTTVFNYFNNNEEQIAKRKIVYGVTDSAWEFFTYDANGVMIADSVVSLPGGNYAMYHFQGTSNDVISLIDFNSSFFLKGHHIINRDGSGNIISELDSSFELIAGSGYVFQDTSRVTLTYDNHPCPFYKLYPSRRIEVDFENEEEDDVPFFFGDPQANNILHEDQTASAGGLTPFSHRFVYQYLLNGYPSDVTFQDLQGGQTLKGYYFY